MSKFEGIKDIDKCGVYFIRNKENGKVYIGSTTMTFLKRFYHHLSLLRASKHKNQHLQRAWNKYGEENFEFIIQQVTPKNKTLEQEQYWMNYYSFVELELYNINPKATGTPDMSEETIKKRADTLRRRYENGELIPWFKGKPTWNKGLTKADYDTSVLKVPKTITESVLESRKLRQERLREEFYPKIYVYDADQTFLGEWRSAADLAEWSKTEENNLPIKSRFNTPIRGKLPLMHLTTCGIGKACKTKKPYKGLYFYYVPIE